MSETDTQLLQHWIQRRDARALNELVTRHASLVFNSCRRVLRSDADAEDAAQDCFVKLARARSTPSNSFTGWLHAMATRSAIDRIREEQRRRRRERQFVDQRAQERPSADVFQEMQEHVDACIAELPEELRTPIVQHFLERMTQDSIAGELGVSRQTITYRIGKGIEEVRRRLRQRGWTITVAALTAGLSQLEVAAAPISLLASLGRVALSGSAPVAASATSSTLSLGGLLVTKKTVAGGAIAAVLCLAGFFAIQTLLRPDKSLELDTTTLSSPGTPLSSDEGPSTAPADAGPAVVALEPPRTPEDLSPGTTLTAIQGTVYDPDGLAAGGVRLIAASGEVSAPKKLAETDSLADGTFRLGVPQGGTVRVWAFAPGRGLSFTDDPVTPAATADSKRLALRLESLGSVSGHVFDEESGNGIQGLRLGLVRFETAGVGSRLQSLYYGAAALFPEIVGRAQFVRSNADGSYRIDNVTPMRFRFGFDADETPYALPKLHDFQRPPEIKLEPGEHRRDFDIPLKRGGVLLGIVRDPSGKPQPGAKIELLTSYRSRQPQTVTTDASGAYRFGGLHRAATYAVHARAPRAAPAVSTTQSFFAEILEIELDLQLTTGRLLSGRVVDESGNAFPDAEVRLWQTKIEPASPRDAINTTKTNAAGEFTFSNVLAGTYVVEPHMKDYEGGYEPVRKVEVEVPNGADLSGIDVVVRPRRKTPTGTIRGRVVNAASGEPVESVVVWARKGTQQVKYGRTDEIGKFSITDLPVEPKQYRLSIYHRDYSGAPVDDVALGTEDITLTVTPNAAVLGRVIDAETGDIIERFELQTRLPGRIVNGRQTYFHTNWQPVDSATGEFRLDSVTPSELTLKVRAEGYLANDATRLRPDPGERVDGVLVRLQRGLLIRGRVVDRATGKGLPRAYVRAHQNGDYRSWLTDPKVGPTGKRQALALVRTDADGAFKIDGLPLEAKFSLIAWSDGYAPRSLLDLDGTTVNAATGAPQIDISLEKESVLDLHLSFDRVAGVSYEIVAFHREKKPWPRSPWRAVVAEKPGEYALTGLAAGNYRLAVYRRRKTSSGARRDLIGDRWLELSPTTPQALTLEFDAFASEFHNIHGMVTGDVDLSEVRIHVAAANDPAEIYHGWPLRCDADGRFRAPGLPPGEYALTAVCQAPKRQRARALVRVDGDDQEEVKIVFGKSDDK